MSELYVDFAYDDDVKREINQLTRKLDSRIDDYRGVRNSLAGINSNTDNLYNANTYLDKKRNKLEEKTKKLERFKRAVTDFNSDAKRIDKEVASGIKDSRKQFCKENKLGDGLFYTIGVYAGKGVKWLKDKAKQIATAVVGGVKKAWEWINEFYEKNKYLIKLVVDVCFTVAAVVTFVGALATGAGALVALWGLANAVGNMYYSTAAFAAHVAGDDALAEELSGKGMKDIIQYGASCLFGDELGDKIGSVIYHGLNIACFAVSVNNFVKDAKYLHSVDNVASKYGDMLTPETITGIQTDGKNVLIKIATGFDRAGGSTKATLNNIKVILKGSTGLLDKGIMGIFGIGILKDMSGFVKDFTSIFMPTMAESLPY